jgi:two-component system, sensor histidine kinase and response regulator
MARKREKLLIVEDEPNLLLGIRDILVLEGFQVVIASDGQQALNELEGCNSQLPDLILSDIMMPVMDGLEFLQAVRKERKWVKIPFIFLTALGEQDDVNQAKLEGVDDYLIKPFDADELLVAVKARLRRYEALVEVQEEAISEVKRDIMIILNHEFRTPLTLVVAYSEMLKDMLYGQDVSNMDEDELLLYLREVNTGASRLRRLVENFILLAELQTGDSKKNYDWRSRELNDISEIILAAHTQVITPDVQNPCIVKLPDRLPTIWGDHEYLMIILRELLLNAIKFSDDRTAPIHLVASADDQELRIEVIDHGRGIRDAKKAEIWKRFYQIDRDIHEDQGAGSGLAICQGLARLHKGRVELVETTVGGGSRFALVLPVMSGEEDAYAEPASSTNGTHDGQNSNHTAQFKFDVVMEGLRGTKSVERICHERNISAVLYQQWQNHFLAHAPKIFEQ